MTAPAERHAEPSWVQNAVWWQVYPLGFLGAEPAADNATLTHRLPGLIDWLDYAVALGASGLLLGPIFASATHGYDTIDHFRIDHRLGDERDLALLLDAAHARGLRVLLDGVFHHVGRGFGPFREVLEQGPAAPGAAWFRLSWPDPAAACAEPDYATFEGHRELVALDHGEPAVIEHVVSVMDHWLSVGADGWRLDAAYAVPREFWATVISRVRDKHPQAYFVGEVIHGPYAAIVRDGDLDATTQYELWKAIWSSLNDRNFFELAWALDRHNAMLDTFIPLTFIGNHDVTRIATRIDNELHLTHALVILLTTAGTPSIYYGDEQGERALKYNGAGGDDAIRPPYPPGGPDALPANGWETYQLHQRLIALRRRHPWLHSARTQRIQLSKRRFIYAVRDDEQQLIVALNIDDSPSCHEAPPNHLVVAGNGTIHSASGTTPTLTLPAHGWAIIGASPDSSPPAASDASNCAQRA